MTTSGPSVWEKYQDLVAENTLLKAALEKSSVVPPSRTENRVRELEDAIADHRLRIVTGNMIGSYRTAYAANHDLWDVLDGDDGEG